MKTKFFCLCFDFLITLLLLIWLCGGFLWQGHLFLKYGADPRRAALILAFLGFFLFSEIRQKSLLYAGLCWAYQKILLRKWRWVSLGGICFWSLSLGVLQTLALRFPMYDVGIFHQILWALAHGYGFHSTISGAQNFLSDHLSPSLIVLAPFYWITQGAPWTLGVLHPLLIYGGVAAWIYFAENIPGAPKKARSHLAAMTLIFGACFDSLWANQRWGFHESALFFFSFSWILALVLTDSRQKIFIGFLFLLAVGSKEISLLTGSLFLFLIPSKKWRLKGVSLILLVVFVCFESIPHPEGKNYFIRYYSYLGNDLQSFLNHLFTSPWRIFSELKMKDLFQYLKTVFLPWLGLPLLGLLSPYSSFRKWGLFLLLPSFLSAALSTYPPLREPGFHYVLELWPVLAILTLLALGRIFLENAQRATQLSFAWAGLALLGLGQDPWGQFFEYAKDATKTSPVRVAFFQIPQDTAMVTDEMTGAWFANQLWITRWPALKGLPKECPSWIVLKNPSQEQEARVENLQKKCLQSFSPSKFKVLDWAFYKLPLDGRG